ncbi:hypothetical protein MmiAt1_09720 [Methanimicrococcus sp. At1]|uniref:Uncharacterized protein n=1 Tax=Methanimicrococcus hacksteinii TaxID=3028293 RepID=A0ABU3VPR2_9EURY|nr:hypothetical protein [Methanimicrococcus sp. At1]
MYFGRNMESGNATQKPMNHPLIQRSGKEDVSPTFTKVITSDIQKDMAIAIKNPESNLLESIDIP